MVWNIFNFNSSWPFFVAFIADTMQNINKCHVMISNKIDWSLVSIAFSVAYFPVYMFVSAHIITTDKSRQE